MKIKLNMQHEKRVKQIILGVVLLLILIVSTFYLQQKSGYYVDEGMTLFLANGNYNGAVTSKSDKGIKDFIAEFVIKDNIPHTIENLSSMLQELMSAGNYSQEGTVEWYDAARKMLQGERAWVDGQELFRQLTVSKGERFQYIQVYINQAMDVHPPFYYLMVHTVFSVFPGTFHNAYLFCINIFALLLTCIMIYSIAKELNEQPAFPFLAVILFGFSQGFLSCAMYFRMYAWLTFFVSVTIYLHVLLWKRNYELDKKLAYALMGTAVLGFYTHYYYIVFLFPLFCITMVYMLYRKKKKEFRIYFFKFLLAGVLSLLIWPFSVYHILFGYRGTEAIANLAQAGLVERIKIYLDIVGQAFYSGGIWLFFLFFLLGIVITLRKIKENKISAVLNRPEIAMVAAGVFYLLIVGQIAPGRSDRYIMCIYPIIALCTAETLVRISEWLPCSRKIKKGLPSILTFIMVLLSLSITTPNYLYLEQREKELGIELSPGNYNLLMVADDDYQGFPWAITLSEFNQVLVLGQEELSVLKEQKPEEPNREMVLYVLDGLDQSKILQSVCGYLDCSCDIIVEISSGMEGFQAYLLSAHGE